MSEKMGAREKDPLTELSLPPGFRFYPTDEELLVQYLCRKVAGHEFSLQVIGEIDLYKFDPWDLPSKALFGEKEWYFFSPRDRKYPNGSRPNRVAGSGYWKATGTDKFIAAEGRRVGIKKSLVFYAGKPPKGTKTNWIMHEYRLIEPSRTNYGSSKLDDWVLCRIYKKKTAAQKPVPDPVQTFREEHIANVSSSSSSSSSQLDHVFDSLPEMNEQFFNLPRINSLRSLLDDGEIGNLDWATLADLNPVPELVPSYGGNNNSFAAAAEEEEEEAESRLRNSGGMTQGSGYSWTGSRFNPVEPVEYGFPDQAGSFGFRQW